MSLCIRLVPFLVFGFLQASVAAQVKIEYVAHSCFVIESPQGVRILIDPYNRNRWLGYDFPDSMQADAVLVTHPHYDHDASYQVSFQIPTFRQPGRYSIGDVKLEGLKGKHADPYGEDFRQINTVWVVETGGKRLAHLGDNGPPGDDLVRELGSIDVLMAPIDATFHVLKEDEIEAVLNDLKPRILVPMHYEIPELAPMKELGPIDPWLEGKDHVVRLKGNRYQLEDPGPASTQILVFRHSSKVEPWRIELRQAWAKGREGLQHLESKRIGEAVRRFTEATQFAPQVIGLWSGLATALDAQGKSLEALVALQRGLVFSQPDDWEHTLGARLHLARLYVRAGKSAEAGQQARIVLRNSYRPLLIEEARRVLLEVGLSSHF